MKGAAPGSGAALVVVFGGGVFGGLSCVASVIGVFGVFGVAPVRQDRAGCSLRRAVEGLAGELGPSRPAARCPSRSVWCRARPRSGRQPAAAPGRRAAFLAQLESRPVRSAAGLLCVGIDLVRGRRAAAWGRRRHAARVPQVRFERALRRLRLDSVILNLEF